MCLMHYEKITLISAQPPLHRVISQISLDIYNCLSGLSVSLSIALSVLLVKQL